MKACRNARRYTGTYPPRCNRGEPCDACRKKYARNGRTVQVEVLACRHCPRLAVSLDDTRVTGHKCAGAWTVLSTYDVPVGLLRDAIRRKK